MALHPETKHGGDHKSESSRQFGNLKSADRFTADTATRTGQSERAVQRDAHRGSNISADVLSEIKGTELDKGTVLDAIAGISPLRPGRISRATPSRCQTSTSQSTTGLYLAFP
ncbi:hypothetical protein [Acidiphilium sp. 34-64-41]|uniref:hypothetical protein n=1 Tax=Acidiphilium sp. 34-64-41 TaxID=1970297 RepID=UPI00257A08E1|nr:hypothetical protein [Acidiphilium sp. 34-64-41]